MKSILHICSHIYPATTIGGPIFCGFELLLQLDSKYRQTIFSYDSCIDRSCWQIQYDTFTHISANTLLLISRHSLASYFRLTRLLVKAVINKQVIFLHGTYNLQYSFSLFMLTLLGHPCIIIPHGTLDINRRRASSSFFVRHCSALYIKHLISKSHLICSNYNEYLSINPPSLDAKKVSFIPNFLPMEDESKWIKLLSPVIQQKPRLTDSQGSNIHQYNIRSYHDAIDKFLQLNSNSLQARAAKLFFFGRLSPEKGLHLILYEIADLYNTGHIDGLVIIGDSTSDSYRNKIQSLSLDTGLPIFITGFIPRPIAHQLLESYRPCVVFPSISDNFNLCLHESANLGLPLFVSSRINSINDISPVHTIYKLPFEAIGSSFHSSFLDHYNKSDPFGYSYNGEKRPESSAMLLSKYVSLIDQLSIDLCST